MKCPKCQSQEHFRTIDWSLTSNKIWVSRQGDETYEITDSKCLDSCDSAIWTDAETICQACGHEGIVSEFNDGKMPERIEDPAGPAQKEGVTEWLKRNWATWRWTRGSCS